MEDAIKKLVDYLKDKKVIILGFGVEGRSSYLFFKKHLPNKNIYVFDNKFLDVDKLNNSYYNLLKKDKFVTLLENLDNTNYTFLEDFDVILKSPGISFKGIDTTKFNKNISSQIELFLRFFDITTIGVTGTKGKSTTSSLIYEVLKANDKNVILCGNIGVAILDEIDRIKKDTIVVLELSSHQLQYIKYSPKISCILNIFEEHLDHYNSYEEYINCKLNILKYQKTGSYMIVNTENEILYNVLTKHSLLDNKNSVTKVQIGNNNKCNNYFDISLRKNINEVEYITISTKNQEGEFKNTKIYDFSRKRNLLGVHNEMNIMFALSISVILKLDLDKCISAIEKFNNLPHRLQLVADFCNVKYYDDSIATVPQSTISAILSLKDISTVIIGGMNRGINYSVLIDFFNSKQVYDTTLENVILMYETGKIIYDKLKDNQRLKVYYVDNLENAVKLAYDITKRGSCVMSPAAASYNHFKNFEERGDLYLEYLRELQNMEE